jgi:transcription initiation factor TFIID subunit 5
LPQKRNAEGGKQGASLKKSKKDKLVGATGKNVRTETSMASVAPRVKPELTLPTTYVSESFMITMRTGFK